MRRAGTSGLVLGALAAMMWSPHFYGVSQAVAGGASALALQFHVVFFAAVSCLVVLFMTGRLGELAVLRRYETLVVVLVLTGGYGFWVLRALAVEKAPQGLPYVHALFYTGPLMLGLLSVLGRDAPQGRQMAGLIVGFVGCALIATSAQQVEATAPGARAALLALGAAGCWAVFALAARPIVTQEKTLPVLAVVLSAGAACLLATCISTGEHLLPAGSKALWTSVLLGVVTVALGFGCWLKCLSAAHPSAAASLWYLALVFGVPWAVRVSGRSPSLWTLGGAVLILAAVHSSYGRRRRPTASISDLIRG
jgi:drug/metabolite transporter (DMT)-like permease